MKRILIFGGGAIGAFYASRLSIGADVFMVLRSNRDKVAKDGFILKTKSFGESVYRPNVVSLDDISTPFDYILICTKAIPHASSLIAQDLLSHWAKIGHENTAIVLIQNGIGIEDLFRRVFPLTNILTAVTFVSASQLSPGLIQQFEWTRIQIGPYFDDSILHDLDGSPHSRSTLEMSSLQKESTLKSLEELITLFEAGGIEDAEAIPSHLEMQLIRWHKIWINATFNPTSILCGGRTNAEIAVDPNLRHHIIQCTNEISKTASALFNLEFPTESMPPMDLILSSIERTKGFKASMLYF